MILDYWSQSEVPLGIISSLEPRRKMKAADVMRFLVRELGAKQCVLNQMEICFRSLVCVLRLVHLEIEWYT